MANDANKRRSYGLLGDVPVGEHHTSRAASNTDGLDRTALAKVLARSAIETTDTLTIGVYGDWGEGKTSLMRLMKEEVDGDTSAVGVWFNAWQYEREEHLIVPLIATVTRDIEQTLAHRRGSPAKLATKFRKGANSIHNALRAVAYGFTFKGKAEVPLLAGAEVGFSGKDMIERYQALANDVSLYNSLYFESFDELRALPGAGGNTPKVVVFIDDLDRCFPPAAVSLLENIKLVLTIPSFSFVLGIAPTIIQKFVERKFSKKLGLSETYFQNYLDKFVQVPVNLPSREDDGFETYINGLLAAQDVFNDSEKEAFKGLTGLIAAISNHNPRSAVRFINEILVLNRITVEQGDPVPVADLAFASALHPHRTVFLEGRIHVPDELLDKKGSRKRERAGSEVDEATPSRTSISPSEQNFLLMKWPSSFAHEMAFPVALAALLEFAPPSADPMSFGERLRLLSDIQRHRQVSDALKWLADHIHICQALEGLDGQAWLRDRDRLEGSFHLAAAVQSKPESAASEPDAEPDWESIERRVCGLGEDPLRIPEILAQVKNGGAIPEFAQPFVKDLRPLSGLTQLQRLDLDGCTSVSDLSPLSGLTQLQSLNLRNCTSVSDLNPLSSLTQLHRLDLDGCTSVSDVSPLSGLTQLQTLYLIGCASVSDLSPLSGLTQLQTLYLIRCASVSDLRPLSGLSQLQSLYLMGCTSVSDVSPLSGLTRLQNLELGAGTSVTDLAVLRALPNLKWLVTPDGKELEGDDLKEFLATLA